MDEMRMTLHSAWMIFLSKELLAQYIIICYVVWVGILIHARVKNIDEWWDYITLFIAPAILPMVVLCLLLDGYYWVKFKIRKMKEL